MTNKELKSEFLAAVALAGMMYAGGYVMTVRPAFPMNCASHPQSDGLLLREALKQRNTGEALSCAVESYNGDLKQVAVDLWHKVFP